MATIQLQLRTWFGVLASLCMPGIAEPARALAARDTALPIMTTLLEMLQQKLFGSKRYHSDPIIASHLYTP